METKVGKKYDSVFDVEPNSFRNVVNYLNGLEMKPQIVGSSYVYRKGWTTIILKGPEGLPGKLFLFSVNGEIKAELERRVGGKN